MGIDDLDRTLPANKLIFDVRRDMALYQRFRGDLETLMEEYHLSDEEKSAIRNEDLRKLSELGVHPYFIPQISRLLRGSAYNHNKSDAAALYERNLIRKSPA